MVGAALHTSLKESDAHVIGTTRRSEDTSSNAIHLDLNDSPDSWNIPKGIDIAIVCAAIGNAGECRRAPESSGRVNVTGTVALVERLVSEGAFVVHLSSAHVFDGTRPHRLPDDPTCPVTEYGRQKAEAERAILQFGDSAAIIRFTKIVGPNDPLFGGWAALWSEGQPVRPFSDMTMSPVPLSCAVETIRRVAMAKLSGIWQVSAESDISYSDAATLGAKSIGGDVSLIEPITASDAGYPEQVMRHTSLDTHRVRRELGVEIPSVEETLGNAFRVSSQRVQP